MTTENVESSVLARNVDFVDALSRVYYNAKLAFHFPLIVLPFGQ